MKFGLEKCAKASFNWKHSNDNNNNNIYLPNAQT